MRGILRRTLLSGATVLALCVTLLTTTSATAFAADFDVCDLRTKVAELRGYDVNNQYNIIVYKGSAEKSINLNGVRINGSKRTEACEFGGTGVYYWAMFKSGTFVHQGDGGYRNWAFYGTFKQNGEKVTFFAH